MSSMAARAEPAAQPALVAVAHGTRDPAGVATVEALLDRVRARRPGLPARAAYLELVEPSLPAALAVVPGPVVVLPLLLATGYHATVDIPGAVVTRPDASVAAVLGPHPLLAAALADRLAEAGWQRGDAVVLAAAGSSDPGAAGAAEQQARLLADRLGAPVTVGYASAAQPAVADAVAQLRAAGSARVAVASYLLAPGFFQSRLLGAGADLVSEPLGIHDAVVQLVLHRYDETRAR